MENTPREDFALELERLSRGLDNARRKYPTALDNHTDAQVSDLFAELYTLAHRLAPHVVGETPHWLVHESDFGPLDCETDREAERRR